MTEMGVFTSCPPDIQEERPFSLQPWLACKNLLFLLGHRYYSRGQISQLKCQSHLSWNTYNKWCQAWFGITILYLVLATHNWYSSPIIVLLSSQTIELYQLSSCSIYTDQVSLHVVVYHLRLSFAVNTVSRWAKDSLALNQHSSRSLVFPSTHLFESLRAISATTLSVVLPDTPGVFNNT